MALAALGGLLLLTSRLATGETGALLATATPVTSAAVLALAGAAVFGVVAWVLRRAAIEDELHDDPAGAPA